MDHAKKLCWVLALVGGGAKGGGEGQDENEYVLQTGSQKWQGHLVAAPHFNEMASHPVSAE